MEEPVMGTLTDKRRTYTFYVDDVVLDVFGSRIGAYGIAVYALLARHAKHKQSFPSLKHMVRQLGISRQTITRTIDALITIGLITKQKRRSNQGDPDSNLYTLLDLSHFHEHGGRSPQDLPTSHEDLRYVPTGPTVRPQGTTKGSQLRDLTEGEEYLLPSVVSYPGAGNGVSTPGLLEMPSPEAPPTKAAKKKAKAVHISDEDWPGLRTLLMSFHFPLDQLDDNEWWNDLSYTCNSPSNDWLERQFAKMHAWLKENPHKQPTTRWKTFMRGWLERAYEYERKTNGTKKTYARK